ncbi:MAG: DUF47 family protein [Ignavibacteriaceae bacterium]|nr:DUF47 family protein [Ignavibacteriaceae bacterium]HRI45864.1 DUF47 family protein [Ignavibacteriaceae bacterium]
MLKKLLPKEEKYFDDFNDMIALCQNMAVVANQLFSTTPYDPSLLLKLKPIENRADEIAFRVVKRLNKSFITPFDREDIFTLIKKLDDICDILLAASIRLEVFNVNESIPAADKITAIILAQIKELEIAIGDLKNKESKFNECKAVKDLESEADNIYRQGLKILFTEEKDAIKVIKYKEILDLLEDASDKCQAVANVIISIFLKSS